MNGASDRYGATPVEYEGWGVSTDHLLVCMSTQSVSSESRDRRGRRTVARLYGDEFRIGRRPERNLCFREIL